MTPRGTLKGDDGEIAVELIKRWTIARDTENELRLQRNSELLPFDERDDDYSPRSAPSHEKYRAAVRDRELATRMLRRFGKKLVDRDSFDRLATPVAQEEDHS